jgi:hypothetical protein
MSSIVPPWGALQNLVVQHARGSLPRLPLEIGPKFFDPLPDEELALWEGDDDLSVTRLW